MSETRTSWTARGPEIENSEIKSGKLYVLIVCGTFIMGLLYLRILLNSYKSLISILIKIVHVYVLRQCKMSRRMGKPTICIGENKGADQLRSNCEADQRLCFRYIPLLSISKISSL